MRSDVRKNVQADYGQAALRVLEGQTSGCCGSKPGPGGCDPITARLYDEAEAGAVPEKALLASFGCGNPTALAELRPGETVLDLGSGGGIDVLLSARRVGPEGKAYGLDMTGAMLELAEENKRQSGMTNVEFLHGAIEAIPLPGASVDVIVSNCVINLSGDKPRVFAEAFRVLKPGGRLAIADVVTRGAMPAAIREHRSLWSGCVAGALEEKAYIRMLEGAGFQRVGIEFTRMYAREDVEHILAGAGVGEDAIPALAAEASGSLGSAFIRAVKPAA